MDLKNKKNLIFIIVAVFMAAILIFTVFKAIVFVKNSASESIGYEPQKTAAPSFQFEKLKEIGIIQ